MNSKSLSTYRFHFSKYDFQIPIEFLCFFQTYLLYLVNSKYMNSKYLSNTYRLSLFPPPPPPSDRDNLFTSSFQRVLMSTLFRCVLSDNLLSLLMRRASFEETHDSDIPLKINGGGGGVLKNDR